MTRLAWGARDGAARLCPGRGSGPRRRPAGRTELTRPTGSVGRNGWRSAAPVLALVFAPVSWYW